MALQLDEADGRNDGVTRFVRGILRGGAPPPIAPVDSIPDPYWEAGSHPDAVERLWEELGAALPTDCRCLVYGTPALVHPSAGVVLAFSMGTGYFVRLPSGAVVPDAGQPGDWRSETLRELGPDWAVGSWSADELDWCRSTFAELAG